MARSGKVMQPHRQALSAPTAGLFFEYPGAHRATACAAPPGVKVPTPEHVPVALYEQLAAGVTVSAATLAIVHVTGVDVAHARLHGGAARTLQGRARRGRIVHHLEVGVEGGEMHRHIRAQILHHPGGHKEFDGSRRSS